MQTLLNIRNYGIAAKFHIVGIGGIGMSGIAEILHNLGYYVQGSDISQNYNTERLEALGIKIYLGQSESNINGVDYIVISSSIKEDNAEYIAAKNSKIPIIKRAEMLSEIMRLKTCISISGSHGKTSTTSMMASIFEAAGLDPTVINGGIINNKSTNAYLGKGDYLIAEADESDATFVKIPSSIGVVTNIDPEHLDYYKTFENLYETFKNFVHNLPFYGFGVICADHQITQQLSKEIIDRKILTYGIKSEEANIRAVNIRTGIDGSYFDVKINLLHNKINYKIDDLYLAIPGEHNVLNSLAAIAVAAELDFGVKAIKEGLARFKGVKRRFTKTGEYNGISFIDDYAHHPTEIKATLATAKIAAGDNNKVYAVFQPHRYSRLSSLFEDFVESFIDAEEIYISPVYAAGEKEVAGYNSSILVNSINSKYSNKAFAIEEETDISRIISKAKSGDIIIFMGAGNITNWAYSAPKMMEL